MNESKSNDTTAPAETNMEGKIVVGVDGSDGSVEALRWAIVEAALRDTNVVALHVWSYPVGYGVEMAAIPMIAPDVLEQQAAATLDEVVQRASVGIEPTPTIERRVVRGSASWELSEASKQAELVVVGARGHGGFLGLLLGSVATQVVNHAHGPVVVVPGVPSPDSEQ